MKRRHIALISTQYSNSTWKIQTLLRLARSQTDGNIITVGAEDFLCAEVLLQPSLLGKDRVETRFDIDMGKNLFANVELHKIWYACVVLTGGTAGPDGLPEHLGDWLTGGPVSERQGLGHDEGPAA